MNVCQLCGVKIPEERLELGLYKCTKCSDQSGYVGFMNYSHKTAPEVIMIRSNNKEALRQARRAFERKR